MSTVSVVLFYLLACAVPKTLGGSTASIWECPYQAQLIIDDSSMCGAVIISENALLTTAHCVYGHESSPMTVFVGSEVLGRGEQYKVDSVTVHPQYNTKNFDNDIAVLKIGTDLTFSSRVMAVAIAGETPAPGRTGYVSGWGQIINFDRPNYEYLANLPVTIMDIYRCDRVLAGQARLTSGRFVCSTSRPNVESCRGVLGGTLVIDGRLVGLVSWTYRCGSDLPDVYTNVMNYSDFIYNLL